MLFTKSFALAVMAVAGVSAQGNRPARPVRPAPQAPSFNAQTINCGAGANPFCCSPSTANADSGAMLDMGSTQSGGTTCSRMSGSSVSCNAMVICCNNNGGGSEQTCSGSIKGPVTFIN